MTITYASFDAVVARADQLLENGFIKTTQGAPALKRPGRGRNRGKGRAFEWLCQHVSYDEKKCLFWPFSKFNGRAGTIGYCGRAFKPVRLMCLLAHGAPPSYQHKAAHTCGRSHKGCIHPKHLAWKTASECMFEELSDGRRIAYGRGGKITPAEAAEIRALRGTKTATEIGRMYGLTGQRIGDIFRGTAHVRPWTFNPREGRFYPKLTVGGRSYSLGGFSSVRRAAAAYEAARMRSRRGEPILLPVKEKPCLDDIRRWYHPPQQQLKFGEQEGEVVTAVEPEQEQSVFVMHRALDKLNPVVRQFVLVASDTGDFTEAAKAAGVSQAQVAVLLPRLRVFLGSMLTA